MKKNYLFTLFAVICLSSCSSKIPNNVIFTINDPSSLEIHTELQNGFITSINPDNYINDYRYELGEKLSKPLPVVLSYSVVSDNDVEAKDYQVYISEDKDFKTYDIYFASALNAEIYNLKLNTNYYFKVVANYGGKLFESEPGSFLTSNTTLRNIYADGVENIRDLGGYQLENGKTFKQGMIYRSAQFNYDLSDESSIASAPTALGLNTLVNVLKIKSDVDIREKENARGKDETLGITSSPLGNNINYKYLPMRYGGGNVITNPLNKKSIEEFFVFLSDVDNYPIDFHCIRGTDRTGALSTIILALMGVSPIDIQKDYLFSNFSPIGTLVRKNTSGSAYYILDEINYTSGNNLREKTINYLKQYLDISDTTLNSVIGILEK